MISYDLLVAGLNFRYKLLQNSYGQMKKYACERWDLSQDKQVKKKCMAIERTIKKSEYLLKFA